MHLPDKKLLLDTVQDFYKTLEAEADFLQSLYEKRNNPEQLAQYRIKVHAMKSTANLIGATVLGGMAKLLENASRDADMERLEALHDIFLTEWRSYKEKLKVCIKEENNEQKPDALADASSVLAYLELLRTVMQELDMDEMDRCMELLEGFQYSDELQREIELLAVHVTNLDSEQGEILIGEMMEQITKESGGK